MPQRPDILNEIPELEEPVPANMFLEREAGNTALWCWGIAIFLILAGVAAYLWARKHRTKPLPPTPEELALKALDALEQDTPPMRELSLRLSLIMRGYLTGQALDPALYETHEEFSQRMDALERIPQECRYATRYLLESLVEMKYSEADTQDPLRAKALVEEARSLICNITSIQQKEAEQAAALAKKAG